MIIDTRRQIQQEIHALELLGESTRQVRTGINATGIYIETDAAKVVLFFTGRHHAGEIVDRLLEHRRRADKLITVTDAASKNFSHGHADELEQAVCHAHCYMKFRAVKNQFPAELPGRCTRRSSPTTTRPRRWAWTPTTGCCTTSSTRSRRC